MCCNCVLSFFLLFVIMDRVKLVVRKKFLDIFLSEKGGSFRKIAKTLNISGPTLSNDIKKFANELTIQDLPRSVKKKLFFSNEMGIEVAELIERKNTLSVHNVAKKFGISSTMVQTIKKYII